MELNTILQRRNTRRFLVVERSLYLHDRHKVFYLFLYFPSSVGIAATFPTKGEGFCHSNNF